MTDVEVWFEAKVTIRSKMSLIREIKNKLIAAQTKIFRETCYDHWLDIKCDDNDPGYIHCLLMNQIDRPKNFAFNGREICEEPEELWFRVTRDHVIRCSRREFFLVTGMRFGQITSFVDWIGQERVSRRFFKDELKESDKDKLLDGVNDDILLLLEDFELMNKYPWGSFIWTKLYNSLHHVLVPYKDRAAEKNQKGVMTYHLSGFTWAFKMWIWESYKDRIEAYDFKPISDDTSFVNYAHPVIIVDGAHLEIHYLGTNLIDVAMDANNGILPLAYGIRAGETTDHWT
ncbi:uncharacterized protein [Rutidosis leptorrhynchoides]|uniref:uncharacterized protein n=1 Tax=Rutidosis leptorrhynchoides TaxID=125765 RepID=UPI003A99B5C4